MAGAARSATRGGSAVRRGAILALAIAAVAGFWVVFWQQSAGSVLTRVPLLDEAWYLRDAARLRREGPPGSEPFVMSPGYTLLVAAAGANDVDAHGVLPAHPRVLLAWQALAWLGCGVLIGVQVQRLARRSAVRARPALAAAGFAVLLFVLYRPAAVYARTILLEIPLAFLVSAALAGAAGGRRASWRRASLVGFLLGIASLLRAQVLVLVPLLALFWSVGGSARRCRLAIVAALAAAALVPPGLVAWHNSRASGTLVGPSLNAGLNLYLGQIADSQGLFTSLLGLDQQWQPSGEDYLAERLGRPLAGPADADAAWRREAWRLIAADPGLALSGWLRKVWLHLQGWEISQVTPLSAWPQEAPVLRLLVVPWALLVVLAAVGAAACLLLPTDRSGGGAHDAIRRTAMLCLLAALLIIATQSVFFVVSRFRLILAPILAVLAGCGLLAAQRLWLDGRRRRLLIAALVLPLAAAATVPWGLAATRQQWSGLEALNHARRLMILAEAAPAAAPALASDELRARAEDLLQQACAQVPRRQDVWLLRALNLAGAGRTDRAVEVLSHGIMQADETSELWRSRLVLLRESGREDEVEALLLARLQEFPQEGDLWHDFIVLLGHRGRWHEAAAHARRLQVALPDDHRGWLDLGIALAQLGRATAAAEVFREGWRRFDDPRIQALFAANLSLLGESPEQRHGR